MSQTTVSAPVEPALPGPSAPSPVRVTQLRIGGMTCSSCATRIEEILAVIGGVTASVSYTQRTATVEHPPSVPPEVLSAVLEDAGYTAVLVPPGARPPSLSRRARSLAGPAVSVPVLLAVAAGVTWFAGGHGVGASVLLAGLLLLVVGPCMVAVAFVRRTRAERRVAAVPAVAVLEAVVAEGVERVDALAVAGALAAGSLALSSRPAAEPVAAAITDYAAHHAPFWPAMYGFAALDDEGATGETGARTALIGSITLLRTRGIVLPHSLGTAADTAEAARRSAVVVAWDGVARAVLVVGVPD